MFGSLKAVGTDFSLDSNSRLQSATFGSLHTVGTFFEVRYDPYLTGLVSCTNLTSVGGQLNIVAGVASGQLAALQSQLETSTAKEAELEQARTQVEAERRALSVEKQEVGLLRASAPGQPAEL